MKRIECINTFKVGMFYQRDILCLISGMIIGVYMKFIEEGLWLNAIQMCGFLFFFAIGCTNSEDGETLGDCNHANNQENGRLEKSRKIC